MIASVIESIAGFTLMLLLVLAVRRPIARLSGAGWAYAAWLIPLLYLFVPELPSLSQRTELAPVIIVLPAVSAAAAPLPAQDAPTSWLPVIVALWAGGAFLFLLWQWLGYRQFLAEVLKSSRPGLPPPIGRIAVRESEAVDGPVAVGFVERLIVVPIDFGSRYSPTEQRLALEHERIHHSRGDIWWNLVALILLGLNWFNPIAYLAFRAFRADQELACDAAVATRATGVERHDYASALVKSASRMGMVAACPLNGTDILKRRLRMMKLHRSGWGRTLGGVSALAVVSAAGLVLASPGQAHDEQPPRIVLHAADRHSSIIDKADLETLKEKCASSSRTKRGSGVIVCENGEAVDDPEVRRIVTKTMERARRKIRQAELSAADQARIAATVAEAHERLARLEHDGEFARARAALDRGKIKMIRIDDRELRQKMREARQRAREARAEDRVYRHTYRFDDKKHAAMMREALERAREGLTHGDMEETRRIAIASAMAGAEHGIAQRRLSVIDAKALRNAPKEAEKGIAVIDLREAMREADRELKRELDELRAEEE